MNSYGQALLTNAGTGAGAAFDWAGGRGIFSVVAAFGGGSVSLEYLAPDNAKWISAPKESDNTSVSLTADGGILFALAPGKVRAISALATSVYARVDRITE